MREIFSRSSLETRRWVDDNGMSALDYLLEPQIICDFGNQLKPLPSKLRPVRLQGTFLASPEHYEVAAELVASGVPVRRPTLVRVAERLALLEDARARGLPIPDWRKHLTMVKLAFEFQDVRGAEARVAATPLSSRA